MKHYLITKLKIRLCGPGYGSTESWRWNMDMWDHKQELFARIRDTWGSSIKFEIMHEEEVEIQLEEGTWRELRRTIY